MLKHFQKIFQKKIIPVALAVAMFLTIPSCTPRNPQQSGVSSRSQETIQETRSAFDDFTNRKFLESVTENTINLHYTVSDCASFGIKDYPLTLGEISTERIQQDALELENSYRTLSSFSYEDLTPDQQLTYDILEDYFKTELDNYRLYLYTEPLDIVSGLQNQLPILFAEYAFRSRQDIEEYLILLAQLDEYYAQVLEFEKQKSQAGLFMPDFSVDSILSQCAVFTENPEDNYLVQTFNERVDAFGGLSQEEIDSYKHENLTIVTGDVANAYRLLSEGLSALKGSGTNPAGLCNYEDGLSYYSYLVKYSTGSSRSLEDLKTLIAEYRQGQLFSAAWILKGNNVNLESLENYKLDLTEPLDILADLQNKIQDDFPDPPKVNYTVKYVPESLEKYLSPAFYLTPPIDDVQDNVIYINRGSAYTDTDRYTTLAHEGYPGHLYQSVCFNEYSHDKIRSILHYGGFQEGWATYVELYAYQLPGIDRASASLLEINKGVLLSLYATIDLGIHADGWSQEDVAKFLSANGISGDDIVAEIYQMIVSEPAYYLKYFVGYLEILQLRKTAEKALGDAFAPKDFHSFLMQIGPAPFSVIEKYMEGWMKE